MVDWQAILQDMADGKQVTLSAPTRKALQERELIDGSNITRGGKAYVWLCKVFRTYSSAIVHLDGDKLDLYILKKDRDFVDGFGNRVNYTRIVRGSGLHRRD